MESFNMVNAFGILQQQHVHCNCRIHKQNANYNIPRMETQKAFQQLHTTNPPTIHNGTATYPEGRTYAAYG
jgi:hypothetical protein